MDSPHSLLKRSATQAAAVLYLLAGTRPGLAALPERAIRERAAIQARWEAGRSRVPERYAKVLATLTRQVPGKLKGQIGRGDERGRWGNETEWRFRETGRGCLVLATASRLPGSPLLGDKACRDAVAAGLDFLARNRLGILRTGGWRALLVGNSPWCWPRGHQQRVLGGL